MTQRRRRFWPQMNDHLPPHDRLAPRCSRCHHVDSDHPAGGPCARWLTVASSALEPPEVVPCDCTRLDPLRLPGLHAPAPRSTAAD